MEKHHNSNTNNINNISSTNSNNISNTNGNSNNVEFVNSVIAIEFDGKKESNLVYNSIINEIRTSPEYRSTIDLNVNDNFVNIIINSQDMTSFRASINSLIRWMMLSLEVINLTKMD